ncbi:hypothetical protein SDC9_186753 [bioreactor metagenome]|uniref:Glucose-1-phosphate adenylyltransferase/Bifunctional protein GlmU-like C-terminal hexapeptide domain-containing protein n=1 Tax=bioreactor metagenome TaxID=1076179 RepID=A0A645HJN2_9ZZZZ
MLFSGVCVEAGAVVRDSIVMRDTVIRAGATVLRTVLDEHITVGEKAVIGGSGQITVLGEGACVLPGAVFPAGAQAPPTSTIAAEGGVIV